MMKLNPDLVAQVEEAIGDVATMAVNTGMPESTTGPILDGVRNRAGMI